MRATWGEMWFMDRIKAKFLLFGNLPEFSLDRF